MTYSLGVTGHVPMDIEGFSEEAQKLLAVMGVEYLRENRPARLNSGFARGFDIAMAFAATSVGIPVHGFIPFKEQDRAWAKPMRARYAFLLSQCETIHLIHDGPPPPGKWREIVLKRNIAIIDASERIAALFNGQPGSTYEMLLYNASLPTPKPVDNIWDRWVAKLNMNPWPAIRA